MTVFEFDGGKKLPMRFNLRALMRMDKEVCTLNELFNMLKAGNEDRYSAKTFEKTVKVALILAEIAKADPPVTFDELADALTPGEAIMLQGMIMSEVGDGLGFENMKSGKRDLVLEELDAESGKNA